LARSPLERRAAGTGVLGAQPAITLCSNRPGTAAIRENRDAIRYPLVHLLQARRPARYLGHPNMISHRTQTAQPTNNIKTTRRRRSN